MILKKYEDLPEALKTKEAYEYYSILKRKIPSLFLKRSFDFTAALVMLILISPVLLAIGIAVKTDSDGAIIFKQQRITKYGRIFYIYKFRTMYIGSEKGSQVTVDNDSRITKCGKFLRKYRLDELPQLVNILKGDMSFVGTRPEVKKYVDCYTDEMRATLLLPAGVTSLASIKYKDEDRLLNSSLDPDSTYIDEILPQKMKYNLEYIKKFSVWYDLYLMLDTVAAVCKKDSDTGETLPQEEKTFIER